MKMGSGDQSNNNRAEEVRRRRTQRSQERVSTATNRVVNPVQSRPVTVRGNTFGTPIHRQAGTKARRQFYLTMDQMAGTEMRLPALPNIQLGWRLISCIIAILTLVGVYSVYNSPFFQIGSVDIQGLQRLSPEEVNAALKLENTSIIEVNAQEIQEKLTANFPELINIQVSIELPNMVSLTATERMPVAAIQKGDDITWVDADGVLFKARGDAGPLVTIHTEDELPIAEAPIDPDAKAAQVSKPADKSVKNVNKILATGQVKVDPALLAAAQGLSQKMPADTQLIYSKQDGLGWKDPQGWQVYIGADLANFEAKYDMYQKIAKHLGDQGVKANLVSVENLNAPFYRLEQ